MWEQVSAERDDLPKVFLGLSPAEPPDGIARQVPLHQGWTTTGQVTMATQEQKGCEVLSPTSHTLPPQVRLKAALHDGEEVLALWPLVG